MKKPKTQKEVAHRFLKNVVRLCLLMMTFITLAVVLLAWHSREQLSSTTVTALLGAWCGELLMSLIKRSKDSKNQNKPEDPEEEVGI